MPATQTSSQPEPILEVKQVHAGYVEGVDILQGINLVLRPGELITVIGANGAGKSTLAKTIFGLVPVRSGQVIFDRQNIVGLKPDQVVCRGMGYVPQVSNVFPSLTVSENLDMGAYLAEGDLKTLKQNIYESFPVLAQRRNQWAGTLSGGERQMLAMGRALMLSPKLLILDEPSAALSPILVQDIFDLVQRINATGTAIILVEQNARKALAIADRGYVLDSGRDRFEGKGTDLLNDPKIAELYLGIGNINLDDPKQPIDQESTNQPAQNPDLETTPTSSDAEAPS
ncbi:neutral amino acid ABC transporter ATP-binding protein [Thalassoporum mexicanum PCC 7367]|uniref:ABC transporter ATP-binding protein n=1 Tax=Thalassoporum mexicanum TaxID=3457544 RepID=UPI00029FDA58|nr:ABC transporter ATP-binding protein [Pseudanabaena sp. PCC 7367]AFY69418.1 neutral amino acid ABC transporter ATP-binding protein [Pseudanabaena sp. PCC 7367]